MVRIDKFDIFKTVSSEYECFQINSPRILLLRPNPVLKSRQKIIPEAHISCLIPKIKQVKQALYYNLNILKSLFQILNYILRVFNSYGKPHKPVCNAYFSPYLFWNAGVCH